MDIPGTLIPITLFIVIGLIIKILSDNSVRKKLIQKGKIDENVKYLFTDTFERHVPSSLKWGIVLIGVGLAFFIGQFVPRRMSDEITLGAMFILAGVGLLIYYFLASQIVKKAKQESQVEKVTD